MYDIPSEPRHRCTVGDRGNVPRRVLLWLLQVFGAVAAVIFGAFTILGWKISEQAISQSNVANMVAFLSFCSDLADREQDTNLTFAFSVCARHAIIAERKLHQYAIAELPIPPGEFGTRGPAGLGAGAKIGISGGIGCLLLVILITALTFWSSDSEKNSVREITQHPPDRELVERAHTQPGEICIPYMENVPSLKAASTFTMERLGSSAAGTLQVHVTPPPSEALRGT